MRPLRVAMVTLAVSLSALAADPFVGTWKQNNDKSYNSEPYSATIRIESLGGNRVTITQEVIRTTADAAAGRKEHTVNVFTLDGSESQPSGEGPDIAKRLPESVSLRRISDHAWERIAKRPGDVRRGYWAVSNDGKMLVITGSAKTDGGEYYAQRVLEKQ